MNSIGVVLIYSAIILLLFLTMVIKKKLRYAISGLFLISLGVLPILYNNEIISFDIGEFSIIRFIAYFFVIFAAKDLFKEGFTEKNIKLKIPTMIFAILLIIFTTIPTLNSMNILAINIPDYPVMIDYMIYIISGLFLIVGIFALIEDE